MMRSRSLSFALLASILAGPVLADCTLPPAPTKIPDGTQAAEPEMIAAMQTLKRYDADVTTYLKCLEFEAKQNRLTRDDQQRRHNEALERAAGHRGEIQRAGAGLQGEVRLMERC